MIRYRRSLNYKQYQSGISDCNYNIVRTLREIKVFGFRGEYGCKAET